jgi:crossover junction endodeoxyribonuclease RuvC
MIVIGIDPGLTGAIATYHKESDTFLSVDDMPVQRRSYGEGNELCYVELNLGFSAILALTDHNYPMQPIKAVIENVGTMPKQGVVSAFQFGQVNGALKAMLAVYAIEYILLHPTVWKKDFGLVGSTKEDGLKLVRAAYPKQQPYLNLAKHHNRADAMMIAVAGAKRL